MCFPFTDSKPGSVGVRSSGDPDSGGARRRGGPDPLLNRVAGLIVYLPHRFGAKGFSSWSQSTKFCA
jgi:hypothetical protein